MGQDKIRDVVYHAMHTLMIALLRHISPETFSNSTLRWQFSDIIGRAKLYATTDLQRLALEKFAIFRNGWAHTTEVEPYSWGDLAQSFAVLEDWLEELPVGNSPYILADHITMARMAQCMCSMAKAVILPADAKEWRECSPQLHGYCTRTTSFTDSMATSSSSSRAVILPTSTDMLGVSSNSNVHTRPPPEAQVTQLLDAQGGKRIRPEIDREQFMWCETVIEHKQHHRDHMKGKRIMLLDGRYVGKTGIFRGWDSTSCSVYMEFNHNTVSIPNHRVMGVFKDQPNNDAAESSSPVSLGVLATVTVSNSSDKISSDDSEEANDQDAGDQGSSETTQVEVGSSPSVTEVFTDVTPPQRMVSRCTDPGDFVLTGSIDEIKHSQNASWVKGRKIVLLSGKWINRTGTINSWSGTTTYVTIDGEDNANTKRRVANRCKIGVLR